MEVCVAEREGFEPPVRMTYNRFRVCHLKPLGHLSGPELKKTNTNSSLPDKSRLQEW